MSSTNIVAVAALVAAATGSITVSDGRVPGVFDGRGSPGAPSQNVIGPANETGGLPFSTGLSSQGALLRSAVSEASYRSSHRI